MAGGTPLSRAGGGPRRAARRGGWPALRRGLLIALAVALTLLLLLAPVWAIFDMALAEGLAAYVRALDEPDTLHAIGLTVLTALVVVPINVVFGVCTAWAVTKFVFPGRRLLITLIELPFSVSPIVAGTIYLFLYGAQGLLGPWLEAEGLRLMFAVPGIVLVSLFVTAPFVARELIPLMQTQGSDEEEAATTLGAGGLRTFLRVTLPNIRWALIYGVILTNARVMGEFGAVSVVSGSIRGQTNTLPLQIELLYNDYNTLGAFAAATTLTGLALVTLLVRVLVERRQARLLAASEAA